MPNALEKEISTARKKVFTDSYDMSFGELLSIYKRGELTINPNFQRYFRWSLLQKTRFIESVLLGIPIPPIFVFTTEGRKWELIDGLQRISTIFEFIGDLKDHAPSQLLGTSFLPSLEQKKWMDDKNPLESLTEGQRIDILRTRIRIEILQKESDVNTKFELFQRLNTGGSHLSEQEVRSCTISMINEDFYDWINKLSEDANFQSAINLTETKEKEQKDIEYIVRFLSYRNIGYTTKMDVHEYLDQSVIRLAANRSFNMVKEEKVFRDVFKWLNDVHGKNSFKKWDKQRFAGRVQKFL